MPHRADARAHLDKGGDGTAVLTGYGRSVLQPKHKQAEYRDDQSGTRVVSQEGAENGKRVGDISDGDWIAFSPMSVEGVSKVRYKLSSPYGVGAVELRADAPDGKLLATTPVPNTGGWDTYQDTLDVPVEALTGTHKLYLVFTSPQDNAFDVDAVRFTTS